MSPKCGSTTIANMLNVDLQIKYTINHLDDSEYTKIIIIRSDIINRFLSGFYEDLFNNSCYDNYDNIFFNDYLLFLYKCYVEKIPNVNNLKLYNNIDIPVWFGNCSNLTLNITDTYGNFCSHIMSQKYAINNLTQQITDNNVKIVELNNLSNFIPNIKKCNVKNKVNLINMDITNMPLSKIKKQRLIMSKECLNLEQQHLILEMYEEDIHFFNELLSRFNTVIINDTNTKTMVEPNDKKVSVETTNTTTMVVPNDKKVSVETTNTTTMVVPNDKKVSVETTNTTTMVVPNDKKVSVETNNTKTMVAPSDRKVAVETNNTKTMVAPSDRKVAVETNNTKTMVVPSDRKVAVETNNTKTMVAPSDRKVAVETNNTKTMVAPSDKLILL
jgi:hypothetical protein